MKTKMINVVNRVRGRNLLWISLVALLMISAVMTGTVMTSTSARMYVDPKETRGLNPSATFSVNIRVDASNIYAWEFTLSFTPSVLNVTSVTSGKFLEGVGPTAWQYGLVTPVIDNFNGLVTAGDIVMPPYPPMGASGTGAVLAIIEFQVIGYGICTLDLQSTELDTITSDVLNPVLHTAEDGLFDNRPKIWPPHAHFTVNHPGMVLPVAGLPITFDASTSNDIDDGGWIVSYTWDFGDSTTGSGKIVDHTFAAVGTYLVSLTVIDNDGLNDTAALSVNVVSWMEGGTFPDLLDAKPELQKWNEVSKGRELKLFGLVGNPTEDDFKVYVEFTIFSKEEAKKLGTIKTETVTIKGGETTELSAIMNLRDTRWRVGPDKVSSGEGTNLVWAKYTAFAKCYHSVNSGFAKGIVAKDFGFKVHPVKHDIAILGLTTNATNGVQKGSILEIDVTMANEGGGHYIENFNITVTYKGMTTPTTTLEVRSSYLTGAKTAEGIRTETFVLDTSVLKAERYLITVALSTLTYELDTLDNTANCIVTIVE